MFKVFILNLKKMINKNIHSHSFHIGLLYLLFILPIIEFLINKESLGKSISLSLIFIYVLFLIIKKEYKAIINSLPFFLLLAPLGHKFADRILYSEILMLIIIILAIFFFIKYKHFLKFTYNNIFFKFENFCIIGLISFFFLSYFLSGSYIELIKGLINGVSLIAILYFTILFVKNINDVETFINTIIFSSLFATLIKLIAYYYDLNINDFMLYGKDFKIEQQLSMYSIQSSFFYTGIFFIISSSIIFTTYKIVNSNHSLMKLFYFVILFVLIFGLSKNYNKTAFVSLGFIAFATMIILSLKKVSYKNLLSLTFLLLLGFFLLKIQESISYRAIGIDSLLVRFGVFESSLVTLLKNIKVIFFGLGPESSFRLIGNEIFLEAKTSNGMSQGAIDSSYITLIFEHGLFFVIFYIMITLFYLKNLLKIFFIEKNSSSSLSLTLFLVVLNISIISSIQVLGIGKIGCFTLISFALCHSFLKNNLKKNENIFS